MPPSPRDALLASRQREHKCLVVATLELSGIRASSEAFLDWLWPLYEEHILRLLNARDTGAEQSVLKETFLAALRRSAATLYVMEPVAGTIRFRGLGRWKLAEVPELLADPHQFLADGWGGGKYKINFHDGESFVGTHNFRTWGDERWREMPEVDLH